MLELLAQYFAFALIACLGAIQLAVSVSGLRGLWLTPWAWANRLVGGLLVVGATWWFFAAGDRARPYPLLEGSQQGGTFVFAGMIATWTTVFLAPVVNRLFPDPSRGGPTLAARGLEALRHRPFWPRSVRGERHGR